MRTTGSGNAYAIGMDLGELRAFVAVAEELHFGRAGLRLGITQPQVSRLVRALEGDLGVELFVRTPRHTQLTEAGAMLLADARDTLGAHARLWARAEDARRGMRGRVSVGFVWSTLGAFLAPLVGAATERHPDIELSVSQLAFIELIPALRRGDIDLAIARRTWASAEMLEQTLRLESSVLALPEGHRFAERATVSLAELAGEPMVALQRTLAPTAYDRVIEAARDRGIELRIVQHVRSAAEALALVAAGIGIIRMPRAPPHRTRAWCIGSFATPRAAVTLLRRPAPPTASVAAITALATELFSDTQSASDKCVRRPG